MMKKLLAILLLTCASAAQAAFVPGPIQVNASGGTATAVGYATGGSSVPVSVIGGAVSATQSGVYQVEPGTNTVPVAVRNVPAVTQSGTWTVQPGNTPNTTAWLMQITTGAVSALNRVVSSSATTVPTAIADGQNVNMMADKYGRVVTMPLGAWGTVKMATATITASTAETVFISTAAANTFNNLIGCMGENTSATNTDITFRQTNTATNNVGSFKLGFPANNVPVGFFPPGGVPQLQTGNWTITSGASVSSLHLTCWYRIE